MTHDPDLQTCEHCLKEFPIDDCHMMSDCWFCEGCYADWRANFEQCQHEWESYRDEFGDSGQYCNRCAGFVRDDDFLSLPFCTR